MHPGSKTEKYIGANWLATQLGINRGSIHYHAVQLRLRYFKFSGIRYLEAEDAKILIDRLQARYKFSDDLKAKVIAKFWLIGVLARGIDL